MRNCRCDLCGKYLQFDSKNQDCEPDESTIDVCFNGSHFGSAADNATDERLLRKDKADFKEWWKGYRHKDSSNDDPLRSLLRTMSAAAMDQQRVGSEN